MARRILLCFRMEKFSISIFCKDDPCAVYHCGVAQENLLCKWQALMAKEQYFGMLFMLSWEATVLWSPDLRTANNRDYVGRTKQTWLPRTGVVYHSKWTVFWAWHLATHVWHLLVMGGTVQLCFWCSGKHSAIVQKKVFLRLWIKKGNFQIKLH